MRRLLAEAALIGLFAAYLVTLRRENAALAAANKDYRDTLAQLPASMARKGRTHEKPGLRH